MESEPNTPEEIEYEAQVRKFDGDLEGSLALRRRLAARLQGSLPTAQAANFNMLAWLAAELGRHSEAIDASRKALNLYESATTMSDGTTATYTAALSGALGLDGQYHEAIETGERAIELYVESGHNDEYVRSH